MEALPEARYRVRCVKVTDLSKRDLCREIANAVGAEPAGTYPTLVRRLQERFTNDLDVDAVRPVLFLDDSHGMRQEVLGWRRISDSRTYSPGREPDKPLSSRFYASCVDQSVAQ